MSVHASAPPGLPGGLALDLMKGHASEECKPKNHDTLNRPQANAFRVNQRFENGARRYPHGGEFGLTASSDLTIFMNIPAFRNNGGQSAAGVMGRIPSYSESANAT